MNGDEQREMLRLVELEYARTTKFIEGSVGITTSVRGWAITVWAALIGVSFTQRLWALALLAAITILSFAVVDAYQSSLYAQALLRARTLERITAKHFDALARGKDNPRFIAEADAALASNKYGFYSNLQAFRWRDLFHLRYRIFLVAYGTLALVAVICALLVLVIPAPTIPTPSPTASSSAGP
ncbi:MAG: hypothetical protein E6J00_08050 [Chloroflexi bacterium]|nr:MAG: hypothetical protein E6J00_08050 [Chloroflexota bacterium]